MIIDPFSTLDGYVTLPRLGGLWLSPDGRRLVVGVGELDRKKTGYSTALWEIDPEGVRRARRLTRSVKGEAGAAFTPEGDLLFTSRRPDPDAGEEDEPDAAALWLQPAAGGDSRVVAGPAGGLEDVVVSASGTLVTGSRLMPSAPDAAADAELRKKRKEAGVAAILHEEYPVRYWDHDLGPDRSRLLVGSLDGDSLELRDLTGHAGRAFGAHAGWDVSPDGRTVAASWTIPEPAGSSRQVLVAIDVATGERRTLADAPEHEYRDPQISPDGSTVAIVVYTRSAPHDPGNNWLALVPLDGGPVRVLTEAWDRFPASHRWLPDGSGLVVTADDQGRSPVWLVGAADGAVTRLTTDNGSYSDIRVAPDGRSVFALRSAIDSPPAAVRIDISDKSVKSLIGPVEAPSLPGRVEEITATAEDGTPLRAWLVLPSEASADNPVPLVLWVHGGPLSSWNSWSWRWNPWLAAARGYAVLLPDPALSTGYGIEFIRRGWGAWGGASYTDLIALTDAAESRPDLDASRTAAMGGSYGGYMANWIAGHTDRFRAIVTHASLWTLDQMLGTTDGSHYWVREMTAEMMDAHSPHRFADNIVTPMLVIHGDKDYRVPIGEALRLWWDLLSRSKAEDGSSAHKFLYFPDENHWILKPQHTKIWYETVFAFLDHHVLGQEWRRPELLG